MLLVCVESSDFIYFPCYSVSVYLTIRDIHVYDGSSLPCQYCLNIAWKSIASTECGISQSYSHDDKKQYSEEY